MCLFCKTYLEKEKIIYENESIFVVYDSFPVNKGHILLITKRHIEDYFQTSKQEVIDIDDALKHMKDVLDENYHPDGYNIGINCGDAAGQSIMHLHVHLIPRYRFDTKNPKGGIRGVIPEKQNY